MTKSPQMLGISGAGSRVRTRDPLITNQVLYQLSYTGMRGGFSTLVVVRQAEGGAELFFCTAEGWRILRCLKKRIGKRRLQEEAGAQMFVLPGSPSARLTALFGLSLEPLRPNSQG